PNRAMFDEQLSQAIKQAGPGGFRLAVIIIDLDNFKSINDTMGHEAGDDMLYVISDRLLNVVGGSGIVARLGGDEFVILLNHLKNRDIANSLMGEIVDKIKQPISIKGKTISVTMSAGISLYPEHGTDPITLKRTADLAMYQSKEQGRNNYQFFNSSMRARADYRVQIESILRYALDNSDFDIHYHPQVTVTEQKIVGAEALIRLPSSKKGVLMPNDFISIAEESRQIIVIDEWVLRQSCIDAQRWAENIPEPVKVAVNISVKTFLYGNLVTMVEKALKDSRLDPKLLELEITENSFIEQNSITMNILNALKKMGVSLAIDDFGTGYSSLSYLKHLPISEL
ncbi:MAG: diguanylate cyclase, partial [Methylococcales bacterium]|nr:diguanylate cyclase [Methylococcales bacterium]